MGGNGNGNDSMEMGMEWEQESHSRTPLQQRKSIEMRSYEIDAETYKSLSEGSLQQDDEDQPAETDKAKNTQSSRSYNNNNTNNSAGEDTTSSSSSSTSGSETPPSEDEFMTPLAGTSSAASTVGSKPDATDEIRSEFNTAIQSDFEAYHGPLPWWVGIIAWVFAIVAAVASGFFIILYTFEFGYEKSKEWCTAVLFSFFCGLLLEQPIKILLIAFALAFFCRKSSDVYPTQLDIVADHSVRGQSVHPSLSIKSK